MRARRYPGKLLLRDQRALPFVARLLSGPAIRQICGTGRSTYVATALRDAGISDALGLDVSLADVARAIFAELCEHYRSDYVYRSAIANKIFLGRHSPATTVLLPELRVWRSKADLVMLNGTSVAYEIKTALDNLDRLTSQLTDYARMFDQIFVVTDDRQLPRIREVVPDFVGLLILTPEFTLREVRRANSNADRTDQPTIVDALRRGEVVRLTKELCGVVPAVSSVRMVAECSRLLSVVPPRVVHDAAVRILKARRVYSVEDFRAVPEELVSAYLESGIQPTGWCELTRFLTTTSVGAFLAAHA